MCNRIQKINSKMQLLSTADEGVGFNGIAVPNADTYLPKTFD